MNLGYISFGALLPGRIRSFVALKNEEDKECGFAYLFFPEGGELRPNPYCHHIEDTVFEYGEAGQKKQYSEEQKGKWERWGGCVMSSGDGWMCSSDILGWAGSKKWDVYFGLPVLASALGDLWRWEERHNEEKEVQDEEREEQKEYESMLMQHLFPLADPDDMSISTLVLFVRNANNNPVIFVARHSSGCLDFGICTQENGLVWFAEEKRDEKVAEEGKEADIKSPVGKVTFVARFCEPVTTKETKNVFYAYHDITRDSVLLQKIDSFQPLNYDEYRLTVDLKNLVDVVDYIHEERLQCDMRPVDWLLLLRSFSSLQICLDSATWGALWYLNDCLDSLERHVPRLLRSVECADKDELLQTFSAIVIEPHPEAGVVNGWIKDAMVVRDAIENNGFKFIVDTSKLEKDVVSFVIRGAEVVGVADEGKIEWVEEFKNVCGPRFLRLTVTWDNFLAVVDSQKSREPKMWAYDWLFLLRRWHRFGPPRFGSATASASSATAIWNTLESMSCHIVGLTLEEKVLRVVSYFEDAEELARVFLAAREAVPMEEAEADNEDVDSLKADQDVESFKVLNSPKAAESFKANPDVEEKKTCIIM